jgi:NADH-quinone oxidoreductase subunit I
MFGLGLIKGLGVTMRHFIESFTYDRKPWEKRYDDEWLEKHQAIDGKGLFTIQYPEQKRKISENFRFTPMLVYEESKDDPRCTACGICARVCPPQCIWIQRATDAKGRPRAQPAGFWIDATVCMSCGYCAEYCPFDAIKMNQQHEIPTVDRDRDMFYDLQKLLVPVEYYAKLHPTDYEAEEAARRAKEEAKREAAEARKVAAAKKAAEAKKEAENKTEAVKKAAAVESPAPSEPDDLKRIEGIGPKISSLLQAAGITTFAQLAETDADRIKQILEEADPKLLRLADPSTWPRQARLATSGKWEALERWQERLKGGRGA